MPSAPDQWLASTIHRKPSSKPFTSPPPGPAASPTGVTTAASPSSSRSARSASTTESTDAQQKRGPEVRFEALEDELAESTPPDQAAIVTSPIELTVAIRMPAMITGIASGTSTRHSSCRRDIPSRCGLLDIVARRRRGPATMLRIKISRQYPDEGITTVVNDSPVIGSSRKMNARPGSCTGPRRSEVIGRDRTAMPVRRTRDRERDQEAEPHGEHRQLDVLQPSARRSRRGDRRSSSHRISGSASCCATSVRQRSLT